MHLVPCARYLVPGTWLKVPGSSRGLVPGAWYLVPGTYLVSATWYQAPGTWYLVPATENNNNRKLLVPYTTSYLVPVWYKGPATRLTRSHCNHNNCIWALIFSQVLL